MLIKNKSDINTENYFTQEDLVAGDVFKFFNDENIYFQTEDGYFYNIENGASGYPDDRPDVPVFKILGHFCYEGIQKYKIEDENKS